jgi:class 3 adenylate cyclase
VPWLTPRTRTHQVETIGDSFLVVSGMLPARADHGRAALRLALDMHAAAAKVELEDGRHLHVRVGIHSGPITTGVIGHLRARFCVFGACACVRVRIAHPACLLTIQTHARRRHSERGEPHGE